MKKTIITLAVLMACNIASAIERNPADYNPLINQPEMKLASCPPGTHWAINAGGANGVTDRVVGIAYCAGDIAGVNPGSGNRHPDGGGTGGIPSSCDSVNGSSSLADAACFVAKHPTGTGTACNGANYVMVSPDATKTLIYHDTTVIQVNGADTTYAPVNFGSTVNGARIFFVPASQNLYGVPNAFCTPGGVAGA